MSPLSAGKKKYVRIPIPLKRESLPLKPALSFKNLIDIHKRSIDREKRKLGISDYGLIWISFFRGLIIAILLDRLIFH